MCFNQRQLSERVALWNHFYKVTIISFQYNPTTTHLYRTYTEGDNQREHEERAGPNAWK